MGCQSNRKLKRKCRKQLLLRNDMKYETKPFIWLMAESSQIRFDFLEFDEHNVILLKHCYSLQYYRPVPSHGMITTKFESGKWSDYETRSQPSHSYTHKKNVCDFFHIIFLFCVTWQLRAMAWCVSPFVTVVTNAVT